jgi:hypothetical protein
VITGLRTTLALAFGVASIAYGQVPSYSNFWGTFRLDFKFDDGGTGSGWLNRHRLHIVTTAGSIRPGATYDYMCTGNGASPGSAACYDPLIDWMYNGATKPNPKEGDPMIALALGLWSLGSLNPVPMGTGGGEGDCSTLLNGQCEPLWSPRAIISGTVTRVPDDVYQVRHFTLDSGDGVLNITNAGTLDGQDKAGSICANVYVFAPTEEIVSCCACKVTPNGLVSLSLKNDVMNNTLYRAFVQNSVTVALVASAAGSDNCNAAMQPTMTNLARGMRAWATTLHSLSVQGSPQPPPLVGLSETPFAPVDINPTEIQKLTSYCNFIQLIYSGRGQCKSCSTVIGAQGAITQ